MGVEVYEFTLVYVLYAYVCVYTRLTLWVCERRPFRWVYVCMCVYMCIYVTCLKTRISKLLLNSSPQTTTRIFLLSLIFTTPLSCIFFILFIAKVHGFPNLKFNLLWLISFIYNIAVGATLFFDTNCIYK